MQRFVIVGSGGSGKTYVARRLGALLGAPVVHLDAGYHDEWTRAPADEFAARQRGPVAEVVVRTGHLAARRWLDRVAARPRDPADDAPRRVWRP